MAVRVGAEVSFSSFRLNVRLALCRRQRPASLPLLCDSSETAAGALAVGSLHLDAEVPTVAESGGDGSRTGAKEWVQDEVLLLGEALDQRAKNTDGFLSRVYPVSRVLPGKHIR